MASHSNKKCLRVGIECFVVLGCLGMGQAATFEVKDGNTTCIKAELSALLSIPYSVTNGTRTIDVHLPDSAELGNSSFCGSAEWPPLLVVSFGNGLSLGLSFFSDGSDYHVSNLTVQYRLNDNATFPGSSRSGLVTLVSATPGIVAQINSTYRCLSALSVSLDGGVTVTFSNMRMEAYMLGHELSSNETVCAADQSVTTATPPAPSTVTTAPATPDNPQTGNYNVTSTNGTTCLLAQMGLQLNITYLSISQRKTVQTVMNLQPNQTRSTGSCEPDSAALVLTEDRTNLSFFFSLNSTSSTYHLSAITVLATWPDMTQPFSVSNGSLDYLRGTLGRSYMCSAEQTLSVDQSFSINMFGLRVQPFAVSGDRFAEAEECQLDEDSVLIPIIVGAALAGLVLIVLIAYLIGRKRSHAGYQTI